MGQWKNAPSSSRHTFVKAGAPSDGTNEVQRITETGTPTGGSFKIRVAGNESNQGGLSGSITYSSTMATLATNIQTALNTLLGSGTVSCAANGSDKVDITFLKTYGARNVGTIKLESVSLTGGSSPALAVTTPTPGVAADGLGFPAGTMIIDTTNFRTYYNGGTADAPNWIPMDNLFVGSGAPVDGTSGTGVGKAIPGATYLRTSNGATYHNTNTMASPTWTAVP